MATELRYITFDTDMGWVGILSSPRGLLRTTLPQPTPEEAQRLLGAGQAIWSPRTFGDLLQRFRTYFGGHLTTFSDPLDPSIATAFQYRVWEMTRLIPYGHIRSYLWVAEQIGKPGATRAVGQALAKNRLPIIVPCHRVLASSGNIAGFTGGVEMKRRLLRLEGITALSSPKLPGQTLQRYY